MVLNNGVFQSDLLSPVIHGFTTRQWGNLGYGKNSDDLEVTANRRKFFETFGLAKFQHIQPRQVHSDKVITAEEFVPGVEGDASYARRPGYLISVLTADCVPILVYHPEGFIAAIHAGWRGLKNGIITSAMKKLPPGCRAAIGPAIGSCCYEIGEDLAVEFDSRFVLKGMRKPHLDLVSLAIDQLAKNGAIEIDAAHLCTSCHPDLFFSYRRDGSSGRMMAFIAMSSKES